jgi:hypothetical protein
LLDKLLLDDTIAIFKLLVVREGRLVDSSLPYQSGDKHAILVFRCVRDTSGHSMVTAAVASQHPL